MEKCSEGSTFTPVDAFVEACGTAAFTPVDTLVCGLHAMELVTKPREPGEGKDPASTRGCMAGQAAGH